MIVQKRFHSTMPGIVANKHKIKPRIGNTCVTKATISNEIVAIIVALGCIFENTHATPILLTITSILTSFAKINNKALLLMTSSLISSTYAIVINDCNPFKSLEYQMLAPIMQSH